MDLGYFRWDYLSLWWEIEPDRFHMDLQYLDELAQAHNMYADWKAGSKVKALGATTDGRRRYALNAWGRAACLVMHLTPAWRERIHRLDIKSWPDGYSSEDLTQLRATLLSTPCGYNVSGHNGKVRQKNDKRDAGGNSLAIGSHKSDLRVSLYARGNEKTCIEFQCSGDMLKRLLHAVASDRTLRGDNLVFWASVKDRIQQVGVARYNQALTNSGVIRYRPTTFEEREALALDALDAHAAAEATQAQMDLDHDAPADLDTAPSS